MGGNRDKHTRDEQEVHNVVHVRVQPGCRTIAGTVELCLMTWPPSSCPVLTHLGRLNFIAQLVKVCVAFALFLRQRCSIFYLHSSAAGSLAFFNSKVL